jgi:hypothetical protein
MAPVISIWIKEAELNSDWIVSWTVEIGGILTDDVQNKLIENLTKLDSCRLNEELFELSHGLPYGTMSTLNGATKRYDFTKDIKELKGIPIKFYNVLMTGDVKT